MIIQMHNEHFYANFENNLKGGSHTMNSAGWSMWYLCGSLVLCWLTSDEVEALGVFDGMQQFLFQCLLISVLGQIQQVEACVRYREIVLSSTGGLDH